MKKAIKNVDTTENVDTLNVDTSENVDTTAPEQPKFSTVKVNGNWYLQNSTGDLVNKFGEPCATVGDAFRYHDEYRANQSCKWLNERG